MANNIAVKRIKREFLELPKGSEADKLFQIEPVENDLLNLRGHICGPSDTPYDGGVFKLEVKIPENYPFSPPQVKFATRIWHPNISSQTGAICLDILKDQWAAAMTLRTVLLSIQVLLASPEPNDPQDAVVARQYNEEYPKFVLTAKYWTHYFATDKPNETKAIFESLEEKIGHFMELSKLDKTAAVCALSQCNWDLDRTVKSLLST